MEYTPKSQWEYIYQTIPQHQIPWETGEPSPDLVSLFQEKILKRGTKILDAGCGLGTQTRFMARNGIVATGIDISETAVKKAREQLIKENVTANFVVGDVCKMRMPNASFEFVYDRGCYHHLSPIERMDYVKEVHRVLVPGGIFHLLVFAGALNVQEVIELFLPDFQPLKAYEDIIIDHTNNDQQLSIHIVEFKKF